MNANINYRFVKADAKIVHFFMKTLYLRVKFEENMDPIVIIDKYYSQNAELRHILLTHSKKVAEKALMVAENHPELKLNKNFLYEASMLHDIGICFTHAPGILCFGEAPYLCHGYLGAKLMREEGFPLHASVCERHTGAGLSLTDIVSKNLPVPQRELVPVTLEEQVICFADKFFSKTRLDEEKTVEEARRSLLKFGEEGVCRFDKWCKAFL